MNLILLQQEQISGNNRALLSSRQQVHVKNTLKSKLGDTLRVGLEGKSLGTGKVIRLEEDSIELELDLSDTPPEPLPLTLILALPRPKMLRRVLQSITSLGVKQIYLINTWKVEKSFWQSPWLEAEDIRNNCILGLEQARDTIMPAVHIRKLFKPFVEDELPGILADTQGIVAHPTGTEACPNNIAHPCTLAIGPEGGFTPYEVEKLCEAGFNTYTLGSRILRVETAIPSIISRLYCPA